MCVLMSLFHSADDAGLSALPGYTPHLAARPDEQELTLLELIDAEYTQHPFYGSRKIKHYLRSLGGIKSTVNVYRD